MARTIGIIGIGHVGVTTAFNLVSKGVADKLVLIDKKAELAEGESFDLKDALGGLPTYTDIVVNDYDALKDAGCGYFRGRQYWRHFKNWLIELEQTKTSQK